MNIKNIIPHTSKKLVTIGEEETVASAIKLLSSKGIGLVVVTDENDEMLGLVSERDIIKILGEDGPKAMDTPIKDITTRHVVTCPGSAHPHDVLNKMSEYNIRHMPVMTGEKVSAVVSSRDIIKHLSKNTSPDEQAMMWAKLIRSS